MRVFLPLFHFFADKRQRDARKIRPAARAAHHNIGIFARHFHLLDRFFADHRLVHQHMIQHRAERILCILASRRILHRFADRQPQRAGVVGVLCQKFPPRCSCPWMAMTPPTRRTFPSRMRRYGFCRYEIATIYTLHSRSNILQANASALPHCPAPVSVVMPFCPLFLVVIRLRNRRIRLVRPRGRDAFILEINVRGRIQRLFQTPRPDQRRRTPQLVRLLHLFRNIHKSRRIRTHRRLLA